MKEIHADKQLALDIHKFIKNKEITVNYASSGEHVPRVEQNNFVIEERVQWNYYQLSYAHLPKILLEYMTMENTKKINFFPARYGILKHYSPHMILHKVNLDFDCHCTYVLGEYVHAYNDPKKINTNFARTLDCLFQLIK